MLVFFCLNFILPQFHHYADVSGGTEFPRNLSLLYSVSVRLDHFLIIFHRIYGAVNLMIVRIYLLYLIIIIKSDVWPICHCLGLGHETMVWFTGVRLYFHSYWSRKWAVWRQAIICINAVFLLMVTPDHIWVRLRIQIKITYIRMYKHIHEGLYIYIYIYMKIFFSCPLTLTTKRLSINFLTTMHTIHNCFVCT